jgi:hypothetical protein
MKKLSVILGVIILLFSACSILSPAEPTATPAPLPEPTPTPDPCSKENILAEVEDLRLLVSEFQEIEVLANMTNFNYMYDPILRLHELRYEILRTNVPVCLEKFKAVSVNYSIEAINYLTTFMNMRLNSEEITEKDNENFNVAMQTSQTWWQEVLKEFNKVLAIAGLEAQPVPETGSVSPTPTGVAALATNEGSSSVNVRSKPTTTAEIVTSIEKGAQAEVIGRNEASDWLQVKLNDVTGWVFAEMVTINIPVDQLPVVEVIP